MNGVFFNHGLGILLIPNAGERIPQSPLCMLSKPLKERNSALIWAMVKQPRA